MTVRIERSDDGVTELVLDRPDKLNAFNTAMLDDFSDALRELGSDSATRCVLLRGEGRAFSVGYDVERSSGSGAAPEHNVYTDWERLHRNSERWIEVWDLPKPVLASVHGVCAGGAAMLCVCADITVVATTARIMWPVVPLGAGLIGPANLWVLGMKRAREFSYTVGSEFSGEQAVEYGWANHVVPPEQLMTKSREVAARIARTPGPLLRIKKNAINRVMEAQGFRTSFMFGAEWDAIAHDVPEHREMRAKIQEMGLKKAIAWFNEGGQLTGNTPGS